VAARFVLKDLSGMLRYALLMFCSFSLCFLAYQTPNYLNKQIKFTLEEAMKVLKGSRDIALLFFSPQSREG